MSVQKGSAAFKELESTLSKADLLRILTKEMELIIEYLKQGGLRDEEFMCAASNGACLKEVIQLVETAQIPDNWLQKK